MSDECRELKIEIVQLRSMLHEISKHLFKIDIRTDLLKDIALMNLTYKQTIAANALEKVQTDKE